MIYLLNLNIVVAPLLGLPQCVVSDLVLNIVYGLDLEEFLLTSIIDSPPQTYLELWIVNGKDGQRFKLQRIHKTLFDHRVFDLGDSIYQAMIRPDDCTFRQVVDRDKLIQVKHGVNTDSTIIDNIEFVRLVLLYLDFLSFVLC